MLGNAAKLSGASGKSPFTDESWARTGAVSEASTSTRALGSMRSHASARSWLEAPEAAHPTSFRKAAAGCSGVWTARRRASMRDTLSRILSRVAAWAALGAVLLRSVGTPYKALRPCTARLSQASCAAEAAGVGGRGSGKRSRRRRPGAGATSVARHSADRPPRSAKRWMTSVAETSHSGTEGGGGAGEASREAAGGEEGAGEGEKGDEKGGASGEAVPGEHKARGPERGARRATAARARTAAWQAPRAPASRAARAARAPASRTAARARTAAASRAARAPAALRSRDARSAATWREGAEAEALREALRREAAAVRAALAAQRSRGATVD